jgi:hypothetical protein
MKIKKRMSKISSRCYAERFWRVLLGVFLVFAASPTSAKVTFPSCGGVPGVTFSQVRAYGYEFKKGGVIVSPEGNMNSTRKPVEGVVLDSRQVDTLLSAVGGRWISPQVEVGVLIAGLFATMIGCAIFWKKRRKFFLFTTLALGLIGLFLSPAFRDDRAGWYPRHAFVFYDNNERIVAHLDICFECSLYKFTNRSQGGVSSGRGGLGELDAGALKNLFREEGLF